MCKIFGDVTIYSHKNFPVSPILDLLWVQILSRSNSDFLQSGKSLTSV